MIHNYIKTLLEEKGISLYQTFEIESDEVYGNHFIPMEVLIEFIESLSPTIQTQIKNKLVMIDFNNGNVLHFLEYLSKGMVQVKYKN
jgi:hypothetical protein